MTKKERSKIEKLIEELSIMEDWNEGLADIAKDDENPIGESVLRKKASVYRAVKKRIKELFKQNEEQR